jgi:SAM-dependent methyltransferase
MLTDGAHYDAAHAYRTGDVPFWTSLVSPGMRVLELACGTGRIAIPLARAGAIVTAVDLSPAMLAHARSKTDLAIDWQEADMRSFSAPHDLDLAILAFNAINILPPDDAIACLEHVRGHLRPNGIVAIETYIPTAAKLAPTENEKLDAYRVGDIDFRITAKRTYDPVTQRRTMALAIHSSDRTEPVHDSFDFHVYFPSELRLLVERAGFTIEARFGGYDRRPFDRTAVTHIVVARC